MLITKKVLFYCIDTKHSLIISDSMVKNFVTLKKTDVICRRGADPEKMLKFLQENQHIITNQYKVIIIHVGTNFFSTRHEWGKYLELVNDQCTQAEYDDFIDQSNFTAARGSTFTFKSIIQQIIHFIKSRSQAIILLSGIIPRPWDDERRGAVVDRFIEEMKQLEEYRVLYIDTPKLFYINDQIITRYFEWDGLHLNVEGAKQLQSYFGERIGFMIKKYKL